MFVGFMLMLYEEISRRNKIKSFLYFLSAQAGNAEELERNQIS